ncbi:MAG TPA: ribonucleoside-diphosphate reductase subunit alpha [Candidatus Paceibacterota bacterium]|nr:ribonucleoside-diphosphate reductase subunit alpha [Candidatus Paceibacterota bacterium]
MRQIKKRNGSIVDFDSGKIANAMRKAFLAMNVPITESDLSDMTSVVIRDIETNFPEAVPSVEHVQDRVELILMKSGYHEVAKHYIVYRYEHTKIREEKQQEVIEKIEESKLNITTSSGALEPYSEAPIRKTLQKFVDEGISVDVDAIMEQLKYELYEGISTADIGNALIMVVRAMIERDPAYSKLAARLLLKTIYAEVLGTESEGSLTERHAEAFRKSLEHGVSIQRIDERLLAFDIDTLAKKLDLSRDHNFDYLGLQTLYDRYFVRDENTKKVIETPQMFWMRIAMGTAILEDEAVRTERIIEFYEVMSDFYYTPSTPTLFHAGTPKPQLSSCYLNTVPDDLHAIFKNYADNAQLSKWSGGIGTDWTPLRATGAFIKGTGVNSQGVIPFLKIANDVTVAINRSGRRRGAACVYLECWHYDFPDFIELRKNTGDERRRTHDMNTASWIPDLFMKRVRDGGEWTLFSPDETPELHDIYGSAFDAKYMEYEQKAREGKIKLFKTIPAQDLWKKMISMLFETGHPWITWKDPSNIRSPQDHVGVVHNSNLCTEITLNTSADETAVCNLGSLNFAKFVTVGADGKARFDRDLVEKVVRISMRMLDNVIDINYYPTDDAKRSNMRHRPVGLGLRGLHDALYLLGIDFDSQEAVEFSDESMEIVSYYAILSSSELAKERGTYQTYKGSKWDRGIFPVDTLDLLEKERGEQIAVPRGGKLDWTRVREHVKQYGMRNSNTMAVAPTATTANIVGCIPTTEPIYKNLYVKSNQAGDFVVVNKYLIEDLKSRGLWSLGMLNRIKYADGSIQDIQEIPAEVRRRYKEVFEIDAKWLIEAAARRSKWIDQSQSLNIFFNGTSGRELSDIYFHAWRLGLKTTYYLRSLGASQVEKSTVSTSEYGATHTRGASTIVSAAMATIETAPTVETPVAEVSAIPSVPAGFDPEEWKAKLARVAAGEEAGVCESCQS